MEVNGNQNGLVTNITSVDQKKEMHTGWNIMRMSKW